MRSSPDRRPGSSAIGSPVIDELLRLRWWNYGLSAVEGADFTNVTSAIATIDRRIASGAAQPYHAPLMLIDRHGGVAPCRYDSERNEVVAA